MRGSSVHMMGFALGRVAALGVPVPGMAAAVPGRVVGMVVQDTAIVAVLQGRETVGVVQGTESAVAVRGMATAAVQDKATTAVPDTGAVGPGMGSLKIQEVPAVPVAADVHNPVADTRVATPGVAEEVWSSSQPAKGQCCMADIVEQVSRRTEDSPVDCRGPTWWFGAE